MGKFLNMTLFMIVLLMVFHIFGLIPDEGTLIGLILDPSPLSSRSNPFSAEIVAILGVTGLVAAVGLVVARSVFQADLFLMGQFLIFFIFSSGIFWDMMAVFNQFQGTQRVVGILILSPIYIIYLLTAIDWWRGRD